MEIRAAPKPWVGVTFAHGDLPLDREEFTEISQPWPASVVIENGYYHSVSSVNPALAITRIYSAEPRKTWRRRAAKNPDIAEEVKKP